MNAGRHISGPVPSCRQGPADSLPVWAMQENSLRGLVRQLSIDQLDNEGRRVSIYEKTAADKSPLFTRSMSAPVGGARVQPVLQGSAGQRCPALWPALWGSVG